MAVSRGEFENMVDNPLEPTPHEPVVGRTVTPEELRTAIAEGTPKEARSEDFGQDVPQVRPLKNDEPHPKQGPPATGQITVSALEWEVLNERWETRLTNQRRVIDNLDAARNVERSQRVELVDKLIIVGEDLEQLLGAEGDDRHRENYRVLRDTVNDLVRVYR